MASNLQRAESRKIAFLKAAEQVFFTHGYAAANIQDIVKLARGSMATLYAQFGSKEGLFQALLDHHVEHLRDPIEHLDVGGRTLRDGLQIIGESYLQAVLQEGAISLYKIVVAESRNFPDLMERIMPRRRHIYDATANFLGERKAAGELRDIDVKVTAMLFIDMVRGQHQMQAISDPHYAIDLEEIRAFVGFAVDLLCEGARRARPD